MIYNFYSEHFRLDYFYVLFVTETALSLICLFPDPSLFSRYRYIGLAPHVLVPQLSNRIFLAAEVAVRLTQLSLSQFSSSQSSLVAVVSSQSVSQSVVDRSQPPLS